MAESPILTLLAAAGAAAEFCGRPEIWPLFEEWLSEGIQGKVDDASVSRDTMFIAASATLMIVHGIEKEMIADGFANLLASS